MRNSIYMRVKNFYIKSAGVILSVVMLTAPSVSLAARHGDFQTRLQEMRQARQQFVEARKQAAEERVAAKRGEIRQRMDQHRKIVLLRLIDVAIAHFERTGDRVDRMPNIDQSLKDQLNSEIDSAIATLTALKGQVEAATTPEELKSLAVQVRDQFKSFKDIVKRIVEAAFASRVNAAIAKTEERAATVDARIQELKAEGKDTAELESLLTTANGHIAAAKDKVTAGELRQAVSELKAAYQNFREIAQKSKEL